MTNDGLICEYISPEGERGFANPRPTPAQAVGAGDTAPTAQIVMPTKEDLEHAYWALLAACKAVPVLRTALTEHSSTVTLQ